MRTPELLGTDVTFVHRTSCADQLQGATVITPVDPFATLEDLADEACLLVTGTVIGIAFLDDEDPETSPELLYVEAPPFVEGGPEEYYLVPEWVTLEHGHYSPEDAA